MAVRTSSALKLSAAVAALLLFAGVSDAFAQDQAQLAVQPGVSPLLAKGRDLGAVQPATRLDATVHLPVPDEAGFDKSVADRYDRKSPLFHKWMSNEELSAWGPSQEERRAVRRALAAQGLTITGMDDMGTAIDVSGDAAAMNRAFGAQMHNISVNGETVVASLAPLRLAPSLAGHVKAVTGLSGIRMQPMIRFPTDGDGKRSKGVSVTTTSPLDAFSADCFSPGEDLTITDGGSKTTLVHAGAKYAFNGKQCGYTPAQMVQHYGIDQLHAQGLDGTGQTIVIVDAFSYPNAKQDANTFFQATSLPPFTTANFKIYHPGGNPVFNVGWAGETALDIQWAHAIAPGAKVVLIQAQDNYDNNLQRAVRYAIHDGIGNVISNSYGLDEQNEDPTSLQVWDDLARHGAAKGISVNFSSGDSGDFGYDTTISASAPASARWATAVGGTSLDVPSGSGASETGWGNYRAQLGYAGAPVIPVIPPYQQGFYAGAGGGGSTYMKAPKWDRDLGFAKRQVPDLAMDGDPYTGAVVVSPASDGSASFGVIGGTSLAAPMFSALWVIADQISGYDPGTASYTPGSSLGLAAALAPQMAASGALVDVAPLSGAPALSADFTDSSGTTTRSGFDILGIPDDPGAITVLRLRADNGYSVLSFNTDTKLQVAVGWDNVTGRGVPNGPALKTFVESLSPPTP